MPKDKRSCTVSNKSHGLFYKPYSRKSSAGGGGGGAASEEGGGGGGGASSPELEELTCPICMESPHNAVLLLCNSVDKGCRPFICDTSYRHSNCLDQYIKAQAKSQQQGSSSPVHLSQLFSPRALVSQPGSGPGLGLGPGGGVDVIKDGFRGLETCKGLELLCPLCRGRVEGWKVVDKVRHQLNSKKRGCAHDKCTFTGVYEELRKHARFTHPLARPAEIDPARQREWWRMESQRDLGDVFSTIHSAMPGATIVGDYVIEEADEEDGHDDDEDEEEEDGFDDNPGEQPVAVDVSRDWWTMLVLFQIPTAPAGGASGSSSAATAGSQAPAQAQASQQLQQHHHRSQEASFSSSSRSNNSNSGSRGSYSLGRRSWNNSSESSRYGGGGDGGNGGASSSSGRASLERNSHSHHRGSSSQRRHRSSSRR